MVIVHVYCHVKPEYIEDFRQASLENARESLKEPGVSRFDLVEEVDDPTRFALLEVYRTEADPPAHKETVHYAKWRDTVEDMLAEPRTRTKYRNVAPTDPGWETPGA